MEDKRGIKPFKYINALTSQVGFLPMVEEHWAEMDGLFHSTSALFRFSKKLKTLKPRIKVMHRSELWNLTERAKAAFQDLCQKQRDNHNNPNEANMLLESEAYSRWERLADLEEWVYK